MSGLQITRVHKSFGNVSALKDISLTASPGAFIVVVGPSGCGKSTLLRSIAGLETLDSGQIIVNDREITGLSPAQRDIAMVFQNYALYPTKSVRQNLSFGLRQRRNPTAEIERLVAEVSETLQIGDLLDRRPSQLSGGQRQRVAIGRAMVRKPKLFLFDEPLSNLDAALRNDLRIEIKRIHQRMNTTSVFVTHDQLEAMSLADTLVVMRDGIIEQKGTPYEVFHDPANKFVAGFIGTPSMHFIKATTDGGVAALNGGGRVPIPSLAKLPDMTDIDLGLRPEQIAIATSGAGVIEARVDVVQELGSNRIVHVSASPGQLSFVQRASEPAPFGLVKLTILTDAPLAFARSTGQRLA